MPKELVAFTTKAYTVTARRCSRAPRMKSTEDSINERQPAWWRQPTAICFIAADRRPAAIKVGVTTRATVRERLEKMQAPNHEPVELPSVIPNETGDFPMSAADGQEHLSQILFAALNRFQSAHPWRRVANPVSRVAQRRYPHSDSARDSWSSTSRLRAHSLTHRDGYLCAASNSAKSPRLQFKCPAGPLAELRSFGQIRIKS